MSKKQNKVAMLNVKSLTFVPVYVPIRPGSKTSKKYGQECGIEAKGKRPGVYFIKENGVLVYIGQSGRCAKKQLMRHFQTWNDRRGYWQMARPAWNRTCYNDGRLQKHEYTIAIVFTADADQAFDLEHQLIKHYQPRDNKDKYEAYIANEDIAEILKEIQSLPDNKIEHNAIDGIIF